MGNKEYKKQYQKKWHSMPTDSKEPNRHTPKSRKTTTRKYCPDADLYKSPDYHSLDTADLPKEILQKLRDRGFKI